MHSSKIISDSKLSGFLSGNSKSEKVSALLKEQISSWALAKKNYQELGDIKKKIFDFESFKIVVQFNPGRMISSSAKVDAKSIKERPCFLCSNSLPNEQKGLKCDDKYLLLVNPFPIFEKHFTIPHIEHIPQEILPNFSSMLSIAKKLGDNYSLFYNGPKCGASAPDHMHFQASPKNEMPIEQEINSLINCSEVVLKNDLVLVYSISNYLRNFFLIESDNNIAVQHEFTKLYSSIQKVNGVDNEPLLNIIVSFDKVWRVFIFPRKAHRPKEYFLEGSKKILLSPAAVDFGGLLITPRKEDFNKIEKEDIINIFEQTSVEEKLVQKIIEKYKEK